jgi:hypothetical protein
MYLARFFDVLVKGVAKCTFFDKMYFFPQLREQNVPPSATPTERCTFLRNCGEQNVPPSGTAESKMYLFAQLRRAKCTSVRNRREQNVPPSATFVSKMYHVLNRREQNVPPSETAESKMYHFLNRREQNVPFSGTAESKMYLTRLSIFNHGATNQSVPMINESSVLSACSVLGDNTKEDSEQ